MIGFAAWSLGWGLQLEGADPDDQRVGGLLVLDLLPGLVCLVLAALRHRAPTVLTALIAFLAGLSSFSLGPFLLAVVSLSARRRIVLLLPSAAAAGVGLVLSQPLLETGGIMPVSLWWVPVMVLATFIVPVLAGWNLGARRDLHESLRREAEAAHAERRSAEERARTEERNRIAREFHDELGHRLSLIVLHAGALEYREDMDPSQVRQGAEVIHRSAHQAMAEVRSTLSLLRESPQGHEDTAAGESAEPQPDVRERIEGLAGEVRAAGSEVSLQTDAELERLEPAAGRHLHRIIQEALTNALRHAPGAPIQPPFGCASLGSPAQAWKPRSPTLYRRTSRPHQRPKAPGWGSWAPRSVPGLPAGA